MKAPMRKQSSKVRRQDYGHLADATLSYDHCRGETRKLQKLRFTALANRAPEDKQTHAA
jgi:hypothetical protein